MAVKDLLGRNKSNINQINRIGRPVKSKASRYAELMPENDTRLGYLKGGNLVSGLTGGVKGYLGFKGARQDYEAEQAYNNYLAQMAEQERQDKLAQQSFENDYKERQLAQEAELARQQMEAKAASDLAAFERQKELEGIKQNNALALAKEKYKSDNNAANLKHRQELREKGIDPDLYGVDMEYTALINDAIKKMAAQDAINSASIELGKSGKVGLDQVESSIESGKPLTFSPNNLFQKMWGTNQYRIDKKSQPVSAPTIEEVNQAYKAKKASDFSNVSDADLLKGL